MQKSLIVGITGGIGSGKSTLAAKLRNEGFAVFDSDAEARNILNQNEIVRHKISDLFGADAYKAGKLDRKKIASIVFDNPEMLKKLSQIVHPAVLSHFDTFIKKHNNNEFVFVESAVIFESGLIKLVDMLILITASENERIRRVIERDNLTEIDVKSRMKNQINEKEILHLADLIINTELEEINVTKLINDIKLIRTKKGTL